MNFIKKLFVKRFPLGAHESPPDTRKIALAEFQKSVVLPDKYVTDMTAVRNQAPRPKCVASGISEIKELYLASKGVIVDLSDDDLYDQCKLKDGIPDQPGTYPMVGANIACNSGIASVQAYNTGDKDIIEKDRIKYRMGGWAYVERNYNAICQAIYQNRAVVASVPVDLNWFIGIISKVFQEVGRHLTAYHGFDRLQETLYGQNSWGIDWIGKVAGLFNPSIKPGHFELRWADYKDSMVDIIAFTDIPDNLLEEAKRKEYEFMTDLVLGMSGYEVRKLQERLMKEGFLKVPAGTALGYFGNLTKEAVMTYQRVHGITPTGNVGPLTRASLNKANVIQKVAPWNLYPLVDRKATELIQLAKEKGYAIKITEGYRTFERQNELYAKGRTAAGAIVTNAKGGESLHNYGVAFDICFVGINPYPSKAETWKAVAEIAEKLGFTWGGNWDMFMDKPHFELTSIYTLQDFQKGTVDYTKYK